jgi:ubiquitin-protein ligase
MSVRMRRLQADFERISSIFTNRARIRLVKSIGNPPEKYQFLFLLIGLQKDLTSGEIVESNSFNVEIVLTSAYPRLAPQCRMLTPIFHPNIAPHAICIGDHWSAGESLPNLIVRIGEMMAYQSFNIKSPLNGEAARWAEHNGELLPLDNFDFSSLLDVGEAVRGEVAEAAALCANCGRKYDGSEKFGCCASDHIFCPECSLGCSRCDNQLCLKCSVFTCANCKSQICTSCAIRCGSCRQIACPTCTCTCHVCQQGACSNCHVECAACSQQTCLNHIQNYEQDGHAYLVCKTCLE